MAGASDNGFPQTVNSNVFAFDGTNWVELAGLTAGVYGAQSAVLNGTLYLAGTLDGFGVAHAEAYRHRPYAFDPGVFPSNGPVTGGVVVVITGTNLCDGTLGDVAGVTLCGAPATVLAVAGSTPLVVRAGPAVVAGLGDAAVSSLAFGATTGSNRFFYEGAALRVLGVNGAAIARGEAATLATGTAFGEHPAGAGAMTNVLRVSNSGNQALAFGGVTANGAPAGAFRLEGLPASLAVGETGTCRLVFTPSAAGALTAAFHVAHNGAASPFVLNAAGSVLKHAQTIAFAPATNRVRTAAVPLAASASSGLAVTFAVAAGPGQLAGGTNLSFTATGLVSVTASQAGNALYEEAPDVTRTFRVRKPLAATSRATDARA